MKENVSGCFFLNTVYNTIRTPTQTVYVPVFVRRFTLSAVKVMIRISFPIVNLS